MTRQYSNCSIWPWAISPNAGPCPFVTGRLHLTSLLSILKGGFHYEDMQPDGCSGSAVSNLTIPYPRPGVRVGASPTEIFMRFFLRMKLALHKDKSLSSHRVLVLSVFLYFYAQNRSCFFKGIVRFFEQLSLSGYDCPVILRML